jgi:hypothetical protein
MQRLDYEVLRVEVDSRFPASLAGTKEIKIDRISSSNINIGL